MDGKDIDRKYTDKELIAYYSLLFPELDIRKFIEDSRLEELRRRYSSRVENANFRTKYALRGLDIPSVHDVVNPKDAGTPDVPPGGAGVAPMPGPPMAGPMAPPPPPPPPGPGGAPVPPPDVAGAPPPDAAVAPPPAPGDVGAMPPLDEAGALPEGEVPIAGDTGEGVSDKSKDIENLKLKVELFEQLNAIKQSIERLKHTIELENMRQELTSEFKNLIDKLEGDIKELKKNKLPKPKATDLDGAYKHQVYSIAVSILDEILPEIFLDVPDYSLLSLQISRLFDDGTVADGLISIVVTINKDGSRYDFLVELPILNGMMIHPTYMMHNRKIIPLDEASVHRFLSSGSYRKYDAPIPTRENIFSHSPKRKFVREDKQKEYKVLSNIVSPVGLPTKSKWENHKVIRSNNI